MERPSTLLLTAMCVTERKRERPGQAREEDAGLGARLRGCGEQVWHVQTVMSVG
jgi:hypothetical protein